MTAFRLLAPSRALVVSVVLGACLVLGGVCTQPAGATPGGHGNEAAIARLLAGRRQVIDNCNLAVLKHELLRDAALDEVQHHLNLRNRFAYNSPSYRFHEARRVAAALRATLHESAIRQLQVGRDAALKAIDDAIRRLQGSPPPA